MLGKMFYVDLFFKLFWFHLVQIVLPLLSLKFLICEIDVIKLTSEDYKDWVRWSLQSDLTWCFTCSGYSTELSVLIDFNTGYLSTWEYKCNANDNTYCLF